MSALFESLLSTSEVLEALDARHFLDAMLRFEGALASAQAAAGLIPETAARSIVGTCKIDLFDVNRLVRDSARAGSVATPLVDSLRETVGLFNKSAVEHVHRGACAQDVVDTAQALVVREALALVVADVDKTLATLFQLADRHAADPMLARVHSRPASVTTFGRQCLSWAAPLLRARERLQRAAESALCVQLGGLGGTQAGLRGAAASITAAMAAELALGVAEPGRHTQRDAWAVLGCEVGVLTGSLGKMAEDLVRLSQPDVREVGIASERVASGAVSGTGAPLAVACRVAIAAAQRTPQRVAALLATLPQELEGAHGLWEAELAEWPSLLASCHGAARAMAQASAALAVDRARMQAAVDAGFTAVPDELSVAALVAQATRWTQERRALMLVQYQALLEMRARSAVETLAPMSPPA